MTTDYYSDHLSANRLRRCYEIAPPRVRQYLDAEIAFVTARLSASDRILELGCGHGRVVKELSNKARVVVGIDTSHSSLQLARDYLSGLPDCRLARMNACSLGFADHTFNVTVCIQNGLSAFHVDRRTLIAESVRVTRRGGRVLLSTYSEKFWPHRLEWFRLQAAQGLLGEIDEKATHDGVIVCKDGFSAYTITPGEFMALTNGFPIADRQIKEVDESSVFCEIIV
ncbi:MAG TPA: class I SAM-dependent methyltransferase [Phycisphaerae bacterium]|nr:class I SAM-dependent methyltransferase [Phycisphaerae bacterium]